MVVFDDMFRADIVEVMHIGWDADPANPWGIAVSTLTVRIRTGSDCDLGLARESKSLWWQIERHEMLTNRGTARI